MPELVWLTPFIHVPAPEDGCLLYTSWIKGQCVHDPYKAKQRQPQLQPVYTRSADTAVSGWPKNFIFFIPLVWRIICTQPWPQRPALFN